VQWTPVHFVGPFFIGELGGAVLTDETTFAGFAMFSGTNGERPPLVGWCDGQTILFGMEINAGISWKYGVIFPPNVGEHPLARLPELLIPAQVLTPIVHSQHYDYARREALLTSEG
jgi:hypothetical protein